LTDEEVIANASAHIRAVASNVEQIVGRKDEP